MRVAIVSFGHVDASIMLAKHLSRHVDVDLYLSFSRTCTGESILDFSDKKVYEGLLRDDAVSDILGNKIREYIRGKFNVKIFLYNSEKTYTLRNLKLSYAFAKIIENANYDAVHFNGHSLNQFFISLFLSSRIPKVYTIHDYIPHSGEKKLSRQVFIKYILHTKRQKIFQSEYCAALARKDIGAKNRNSINMVPYSFFDIYKIWKSSSLSEKSNNVLFFGRISAYKGVEYLSKAIPIIKRQIPGLKVILAGKGNYYFDISRLLEGGSCEVINRHIPNEELVELIQQAAIVICPYTDATQSGVVMTAYAFDKPVVATDTGGMREVIEDGITGLLVPPRDSQRLAEAVIDLLKNPEKREKMSKEIRGNLNRDKFKWSLIADKTIEVYRKALVGSRAGEI